MIVFSFQILMYAAEKWEPFQLYYDGLQSMINKTNHMT